MLNGADYNTVDSHGRTSMYIAAEMGHEDAVLEHLNNGYGKTILSLPAKDSGTLLLQLLLWLVSNVAILIGMTLIFI